MALVVSRPAVHACFLSRGSADRSWRSFAL